MWNQAKANWDATGILAELLAGAVVIKYSSKAHTMCTVVFYVIAEMIMKERKPLHLKTFKVWPAMVHIPNENWLMMKMKQNLDFGHKAKDFILFK